MIVSGLVLLINVIHKSRFFFFFLMIYNGCHILILVVGWLYTRLRFILWLRWL